MKSEYQHEFQLTWSFPGLTEWQNATPLNLHKTKKLEAKSLKKEREKKSQENSPLKMHHNKNEMLISHGGGHVRL